MSNETSRRRLELVGTVPAPAAPRDSTRPDVHVGQLWIAHADAGPDVLVLVTDVADDHVQALLCTDDDGIATETDAVLAPGVTGCAERLLVHGDVAGSIPEDTPGEIPRADRSGDRASHRSARLRNGFQLH